MTLLNPPPARRVLLAGLALASAGSLAQTVAPPAPAAPAAPAPGPAAAPQQIEITGGREDATTERRQSTAAKIVIGREQIDQFGDATLGEVLRRLPGVTTPGAPGRGGPPRLRGLGSGYTQLLIDGQRMPPGFSLESLTPDQVERIEILRAPTAETGARAIAGTINIITRDGFRRRVNELRAGVGHEAGRWSPGGFWSRNDSAGPLSYNVSSGLFVNRRLNEAFTETRSTERASGALRELTQESGTSDERRIGLSASGRLQWRLGDAGDSIALQPNLFTNRSESERRFALDRVVGGPSTPRYDRGETDADSRFTTGRLGLVWRQRLPADVRMELNAGAGASRSDSHSLRIERDAAGLPLRTLETDTGSRERTLSSSAKFSRLMGGEPGREHSLVSGLELESVKRDDARTTVDNGVVQAPEFGAELSASSLRSAAYVQDEWSLNPNWALHAGLRWERIATTGQAQDGVKPRNTSRVTTPLVHVLYKPDPKGRDQIRLSLTRSYRAPGLGQLIARPSLSTRYPTSGANEPTSPDSAGNPALQPELATGIDLAVERYLAGGGVLSANLFHRRIGDLIRNVVALESVSWSPVPRWVSRPQNIGGATTSGLEMDARFRLDQAIEGAPRVEMRANLALYRSSVDSVPGPDNRLDQQAKATGNIGADYRLRGTPLTLGGNLNWVPGYETQLAPEQRSGTSAKRVLDVYALWTFSPAVGLRVSASNVLAEDSVSTNAITTPGYVEATRSVTPTDPNLQLRLEFRL